VVFVLGATFHFY